MSTSHLNESMSYVNQSHPISHIQKSCHTSIRHVTYQWVTPHDWSVVWHINGSCHILMLHLPNKDSGVHEGGHVTYVNESYQTSKNPVSRQWSMSHINQLGHTSMKHVIYHWVMPHDQSVVWHIYGLCHILMRQLPNLDSGVHEGRHVTYVNESYHISKNIQETCHTSMRHVTYQWAMPHDRSVVWHINGSCHMLMRQLPHKDSGVHNLRHVTYARVM